MININPLSANPENDQTLSNNSAAFGDELFECLSILWVGTERVKGNTPIILRPVNSFAWSLQDRSILP